MTEHIGAAPYERSERRTGRRNGRKPRRALRTRVGTLNLLVPQDREGTLSTRLFSRYQRNEKALVLALMEMYVEGVSTRKVKDITEALCGTSFSKSLISSLARRLWNFRSITYNTMQYAMFLVIRDVRSQDPQEIAALLRSRLDAEDETFASNDRLRMHQQNRRAIHYLLARITDHIERSSGYPSRFVEYMTRGGKNGYEVEHIWADKPERHAEEFSHPADFAEYRNRIGGLLLLPKSFNASYGDLPYEERLPHYNGQNLLARCLHPGCYERNPGFLRYVEQTGLSFGPHEEFRRADLDARQELYRKLAEEIWDPEHLEREATRKP